ncbi:MAG: hypothetical protein ACRDFB_08730, partial [Rhabdochlamydiaceae bacterium]
EHLLEEYNKKYNLSIGENDELNLKIFRKRSKGNTNAELFIKSLDEKLETLKGNSIWVILWKKRNINIHKSTVKPSFMIKITTDDPTMPLITYSPPNGMNMIEAKFWANKIPSMPLGYDNNGLKNTKSVKITQSLYWYLNDYAEMDLNNICSIFLSHMKNLVSITYQEFP